MKPLLRLFFLSIFLLVSACGTIEVSILGTPTSDVGTTQANTPIQPTTAATLQPAHIENAGELGMVYFWMSKPAGDDPSVRIGSIAHLPGSCVAGLSTCPPPEELETPFQIYDVDWQAISWSPDGSLGVLPVAMEEKAYPTVVYLYNPQNETWKELDTFNFADGVTWSPDGEWIAMRVQDGLGHIDIYAIRPDGSGLRNLSAGLPEIGEPIYLSIYGWLDGKALIGTSEWNQPVVPQLVDPATGRVQRTLEFDANLGGIFPGPDGALAVSLAMPTNRQTLQLISVLDEAPDILATFSNGRISFVTWSHDGQKIAFSVMETDQYAMPGQHRVFVINRDGSGLTEVYPAEELGLIMGLSFSPDDRHLLIYEAGQSKMVTVALDTLEQTVIYPRQSEADVFFLHPSWQP